MDTITVELGTNTWSILHSKLRHFCKRSLLKYIVAVGMVSVGAGLMGVESSSVWSFVQLTGGIILLSLLLIIVATVYQGQKHKDRVVELTFSTDAITVTVDSEVTTTDWKWVIAAKETETQFILDTKTIALRTVMISKNRLQDTEVDQLRTWLQSVSKL